jgi:hypothetical protein
MKSVFVNMSHASVDKKGMAIIGGGEDITRARGASLPWMV